jgi:hypothetical protein
LFTDKTDDDADAVGTIPLTVYGVFLITDVVEFMIKVDTNNN